MKLKTSILISLLSAVLLIGSFFTLPFNDDKEKTILQGLLKFMEVVHYSPEELNDASSAVIFEDYLSDLDPGKRFLTQEDLEVVFPYKMQLDDMIKASDLTVFDLTDGIMEKAILRAENIYNEVAAQEYDFEIDETINLDNEEKPFAQDDAELKEYWRKSIKYDLLNRMYREVKDREKIKDESKKKTDEEIYEYASTQSKKTFTDWFKRLKKERRSDRYEIFLNSIANYFDPHTDYFSPKAKEDFDINMGGKLIGIGARLSPKDDYTRVSDIVVGGPAYKGKELETDDLILKVRQDDQEIATDVIGMRLDDVVSMIRGEEGTKVILTVKKQDGTMKDIEIIREVVDLDDSNARSLLLDAPGFISNIGYIKLPKFYSSFESENGNSSADDVAAELEKLKSNNVNGVILDLRNNTGGSLQDVIEMSGLFIEEGPIVQVKPRDRSPYVHKDTDKSVVYDGPLIVMVNNISASASEILAAALQDYGRAIIVGSPSTYGKGTVQRFFDLDRAFPNNPYKPLGSVKITLQKYFRVNGGSTQLKGVESDIVLPDSWYYMETGEKNYDNAMEWTEIEPTEYGQNVVKLNHLDEVKALSNGRIASNQKFDLVLENAKRLKENRDQKVYTLNKKDYFELMQAREKAAKKYDKLYSENVEGLKVKNLEQDLTYINEAESRVERNTEWLKDVQKDFYLEETLAIIRDMIALEESFSLLNNEKVIRP